MTPINTRSSSTGEFSTHSLPARPRFASSLPSLSYSVFWLGLAGVAAGVMLASFFKIDTPLSDGTDSPAVAIGLTRIAEKLSWRDQPAQSPTLQQLIDSGQLEPPPGDPRKMYSIASPFNHATPAPSQGEARQLENQELMRPQLAAVGSTMDFYRSDQTAVINTSLESQLGSSPVPTAHQTVTFDTPPGVGSTTGGH